MQAPQALLGNSDAAFFLTPEGLSIAAGHARARKSRE